MQRDDFMKLKLKFAQTDVAGKIAIYTETPGLSAAQYKELLRMYPIDRLEELEAANVFDCIECGSCSYICPGRVHLVHNFRTGKQKINNQRAAAKAAAEAAEKAEAK